MLRNVLFLCAIVIFMSSCARKADKHFLRPSDVKVLESPEGKAGVCDQSISYAPDEQYPEHTPMRYINLRFHVMRHDPNDVHTFNEEELNTYVPLLLERVNNRCANNNKMVLPEGNDTPVLPFRMRFKLFKDPNDPTDTGIKIHYDKDLCYFNVKSSINGHYDKRAFDKYSDFKDQTLNVFLFEHHPDSVLSDTYGSKIVGTGFPQWMRLVGNKQHLHRKEKDGTEWLFTQDSNFMHEVGHTLGLSHSWIAHDGCDDTPPHPNCWDRNSAACPDGVYSNNMMDYNNRTNAITPCQLGKIHYNFSKLGSTQRNALQKVWCVYKPETTINIGFGQNVVWNSAKDIEGDIVIGAGGKLTIQCRVSLPKGAKIVVKPRGELVLDGAQLTNLCDEKWQGIEVWSSRKEKGRVSFMNGPVLMNLENPLMVTEVPQ